MISAPRPSILPAWAACACYDGEEEAGDAAKRGTLQHKYLECLLRGVPEAETNRTLENLALELKIEDITEEECEGVRWAHSEIKLHANGRPIESEIKLYYYNDPEDFDPIFSGTADAACGIDMWDLKTGRGHDYKWQMAAYASMQMQRKGLKEVNVHLLYSSIQRKVSMVFEDWKAKAMVDEVLALRNAPNKRPTPCTFCNWCQHRATCNELVSLAKHVGEGREDFTLQEFHASKIEEPEQMARALKLSRFMKVWAEAVEHHAKELAIKQGLKIPGFKVGTRQGAREIKDVATAFGLSSLPITEFLPSCSVSITSLEKKLGKKEFEKRLASVVTRKPESTFLTEE